MSKLDVIKDLVPDSIALLALAEVAVERVRAAPDDACSVLSAFIMLNSLRDWVRKEGRSVVVADCPYYETVREIANGSKHLTLTSKAHPDPHVEGLLPQGDWGTLAWEDLGNPNRMISVLARENRGGRPYWRSALGVLETVVAWWRGQIAPRLVGGAP